MKDRLDAAWKRRQLDYLEKNLGRLSYSEAERQAVRERIAKWCDHFIAADTDEHWLEVRESMKRTRQGRRLRPEAGFHERLIALANRLEISFKGCPPLTRSGRDFVDPDAPEIERLEDAVKVTLLIVQPEFETMKFGAGRPRGRRNKAPASNVSKEALRQRRRRQKNRDKYSG